LLLRDPHLRSRGFWQAVTREFVGEHSQPSPPFRESADPYLIRAPAPTLGQPRLASPGSMVTVELDNLVKETRMHVPLDALVDRDGKTWAFVVLPGPRAATATVKMRALDIARAEDKEAQVKSGLSEGERIVREGAYFLNTDDTVRLLD